jgi:plastocyanin
MNYNNGETLTTSKNIIFVVALLLTIAVTVTLLLLQYTDQLATAQQMSQANNVTANSITNTTNMTYAARSTAKAQNVSIVPDASALDDKSYQPNPVNINIGDTIIWKNDDNIPITHTVTSGTVDADNAGMEFDSGSMNANDIFEHKFTSKGEFPYFCQIHPNMIAKVIVH